MVADRGVDPPDPDVTYHFVESIPVGVDLKTNMTIAASLIDLISKAKKTLDIACFYMTFTGGPAASGGTPGQQVYDAIVAAAKRGVYVRIVATTPSPTFPQDDPKNLAAAGLASVRFLDFEKVLGSNGVLHTKLMTADNTSFYVGSANMDWRSLTQVKELGLYIENSSVLANQVNKNFEVMWLVAGTESVPASWPSSVETWYNADNPLHIQLNGTWTTTYLSMAPPRLTPPGWEHDIDDIVRHMQLAEEYIHIEVMDYLPAVVYATPSTYWGTIDNAIRAAAYRNVSVELLIGYWRYSDPLQQYYLHSLNDLPNVDVQYFEVPATTPVVPYTRVNHAKWMVTDKGVFIGTSNWTGDYFTNTCGMGVALFDQLSWDIANGIFHRDWTSTYTSPLPPLPSKGKGKAKASKGSPRARAGAGKGKAQTRLVASSA